MALISCTNCGKNISEQAKKCPHCNKRVKKNVFILPVIILISMLVVCVGIFYGMKQYQKIKEEKRKMQIESLLSQIDKLYAVFDFESIEKKYNELEGLHCDMKKQREILAYDKKVYPDAYAYFEAINEINKILHSGNYYSLNGLVNKMKKPTDNFNVLEINLDSEIGKYINNVRSNSMYTMFNSEFVNSSKNNLDYYLTTRGYAGILQIYTEEIAKEKFPYIAP